MLVGDDSAQANQRRLANRPDPVACAMGCAPLVTRRRDDPFGGSILYNACTKCMMQWQLRTSARCNKAVEVSASAGVSRLHSRNLFAVLKTSRRQFGMLGLRDAITGADVMQLLEADRSYMDRYTHQCYNLPREIERVGKATRHQLQDRVAVV
jgi:hypothetical protein